MLCGFSALSQKPVITSVSASKGSINEIISISGSGFASKADLQVMFGAAEGTITESNSTTINVMVPAGATFGPVSVLNKTSGLSAGSSTPFSPAFGGSGFSADKLGLPLGFDANTNTYDLILQDLDQDGLPEAITSDKGTSGLISIYKNASDVNSINFSTREDFNVGGATGPVVSGDLDGDGLPDLVFKGYGASYANNLYLLKNNSTSTGLAFTVLPKISLTNTGDGRIILSDVNKDGKQDIIVTQTDNVVYIYTNNSTIGNISFNPTPVQVLLPAGTTLYGLDVADLDGDNKPEIIVAVNFNRNIYVLPNQSTVGSIQFGSAVMIPTSGGGFNLMVGDLDGDKKPDIALTFPPNNYIGIWLNKSTQAGTFQFGAMNPYPTEPYPWGLHMSDVDGDGLTDILLSQRNSTNIAVIKNSSTPGTVSFTPYTIPAIDPNWFIRAGDVNGDGKPDILYTNNKTSGNKLYVLKNKVCISAKLNVEGSKVLCENSFPFQLTTFQGQGLSYTWKLNGVTIPNENNYYLENFPGSGDYTVTITESGSDCGTSTSPATRITLASGSATGEPQLLPVSPICEGNRLSLSATPVTGATYIWTGPNNFSKSTTTPNVVVSESATLAMTGTYSLRLETGACSSDLISSQFADILTATAPVINFTGSSSVCANQPPILLSVSGPYSQYQWFKSGVPIQGANGPNLEVQNEGNYTVKTTTSSGGCQRESNPVVISRGNAPDANFESPEVACLDQKVSFTNKTTATINEPLVYVWSFGDGNTSTTESPEHTYTSSGSFTVSLKVRYQNANCEDEFTKTIQVNEMTDVVNLEAPGGTLFCQGDSVLLQASGDVMEASWSTGETGLSIMATEAGTYTATILTQSGCTINREITVSTMDPPAIEVTTDKTIIRAGEVAQLQASGGSTYEWSPAEGLSDPGISNPVAKPLATTTYTVWAFNEEGCSSSTEITIEVDTKVYVEANKIFIPGQDTFWKVENIENYPTLTLFIMNRFGKIVYTAKPYQNYWDGYLNGRQMEEGVYYFVFKNEDGEVVKTGSITIIN